MAALVLVALVPAVGVLWFMTVAMRNERFAEASSRSLFSRNWTSLRVLADGIAN